MTLSCQNIGARAKTGPPVQLWQANFDHMGPILVTKTGPHALKMDPVQYWLTKTGPSPILAYQNWTQSNIGLPKLDPVQYWLTKTGPSAANDIGLPAKPSHHASHIQHQFWLNHDCSYNKQI